MKISAIVIFNMKTLCMLMMLLFCGITMASDNDVVTKSGPIRGTTIKSATNKDVDVFYGIPYAAPPVGKLRFAPPEKAQPWTEELDATQPSLACYQRMATNLRKFLQLMLIWIPMRPWSEDCLKLHIWVPRPRPKNAAIMVYIHGGGFYAGDPTRPMTSGVTLAAEENVIVVSMNYRLSSFGFAYLGIPEAPGNLGLRDQQLALQWVKENIASFGGNPDQVTIFGMSAGGASVGYHVLVPSSRNLFQRAILMSGAPSAGWAFLTKEEALDRTLKLAAYSGCDSDDKKKVLECMQYLHPEHHLEFTFDKFTMTNDDKQFVPIADGEFLPDTPSNILRSIQASPVDIMVGGVEDEGAMFLPMLHPEEFGDIMAPFTTKLFQAIINRTFKNYNETARKMMSFLYTNWTNPEDSFNLKNGIEDLISDAFFHCPGQEFATSLSAAGNSVYRYLVVHKPSSPLSLPQFDWVGAMHGSDTLLHFGLAATENLIWSSDENKLSRTVMKWWANFARTGDPNGDDDSVPKWPKSSPGWQEYMNIDIKSSVGKNFRTENCVLLNAVLTSTNTNIRSTKDEL